MTFHLILLTKSVLPQVLTGFRDSLQMVMWNSVIVGEDSDELNYSNIADGNLQPYPQYEKYYGDFLPS